VTDRRILIVEDSPALRETIAVLLGSRYRVETAELSELGDLDPAAFDVTIAPLVLRSKSDLPRANYVWIGGPTQSGVGILPRRFTPSGLRRAVATALEAPRQSAQQEAASWRFDTPFLDAAAADVMRRATGSGLALHIRGEAGSGKHTFARSVHAAQGAGPLLLCDADHSPPAPEEVETGATLLAVGVDRWSAAAQRQLDALLATTAARVISTATEDLGELVDAGSFDTDLFYRLCLLRVHLVPLRDRSEDIPAIARALANEIATRLGRPHPTLTSAALERLSHYLWFGNLSELEAVLTRSIALAAAPTLEAGDILFDGDRLSHSAPVAATDSTGATANEHAPPQIEEPEAAAPQPAEPPVAAAREELAGKAAGLDQIIHELAHEFKNPLVTIKTFAQHCEHTMPAGSDDSNFAKMTGDAIKRIDRTLENLLEFTRMATPAIETVPLEAILEPIFGPKRNGSGVPAPVDYVPPPPVFVRVDKRQTIYAISNLMKALTRGTITHQPISVSFLPPDALLCQLPFVGSSISEKLADLGGGDDPDTSIGVAIATTVLERNGAELSISKNSSPKTVMIRFPMVENEEAVANRNG